MLLASESQVTLLGLGHFSWKDSTMPKKKRKSVSKLRKEAWTVFARLVKLRNADDQGYCHCFTCGKKLMWNDRQMHAGHFMSRRHNATLYNTKNVQPQCSYCNMFCGGEQYEFGLKLNEKYGPDTADELTVLSKQTKQFTTFELEEMIATWKQELRDLGY